MVISQKSDPLADLPKRDNAEKCLAGAEVRYGRSNILISTWMAKLG